MKRPGKLHGDRFETHCVLSGEWRSVVGTIHSAIFRILGFEVDTYQEEKSGGMLVSFQGHVSMEMINADAEQCPLLCKLG